MLNALCLALQFFTILPMPGCEYREDHFCLAVYFYPLIGLLMGCCIALLAWILPGQTAGLNAIIVLIVWVLFTGGLHLDGLADMADGWVGGYGDKQKTLEIMKDPSAGPMAVIAITLLLGLKAVTLYYLINMQAWFWIALSPLVARTWIMVFLLITPYAKPEGIGAKFQSFLQWHWVLLLFITILLGSVVVSVQCLWVWMITLLVGMALRAIMIARLQGTTGDTAGMVIEGEEAMVLLCGVFIIIP